MPASDRTHPGGLELSRLTLASLAVWLAVTCLVAVSRMPVTKATASSARATDDASVAAARSAAAKIEPVRYELAGVGDEIAENLPPPLIVKTTALAAVAAVPTGPSRFVFQEDVGGQLLSTKLTPPARFEVWPVPFVSEPKPWRTLKLDPLPRDISALTRTIIRQEPRVALITPREGLSFRVLDLPGLPREIALTVPTPMQVFPMPRNFVPSADPLQVPFLAISTAPPKEKIDSAANPVRTPAESALFQARLLSASLPTAFVKLAIPEPFEQIRAVQLTSKLPDLDPALFPAGQPSQPHFPVIDVPGKSKQ
jgi:hypothetical protein